MKKSPKQSPYGKVVTLTVPVNKVECWNFVDGSTHTLPAGTMLKLENVHESGSTTCMLVDKDGNHPGIMLQLANGTKQRGYRFILKNATLNRLANAKLPRKAFDIVGAIMAYESGQMPPRQTLSLFRRLKKDGLLSQLQGHYKREAARLGVA
jgi:hypothetical protein